jgi:hypothetical protein
MAVSGTISTTTFETRKVIDHALRRCRLPTQLITSEHIQIAQDVLYLLMSELVNRGIPLWCIEKQLLPLYEGMTQIDCPTGTVDVLNLNIRQLQRIDGSASATSGTADNAFDGDVETDCTQLATGGSITLEFDSETAVGNFGILPAATATWDISIQTSPDGVTYTTVYANTEFAAVTGEWQWIDVIAPDTTDESVALNAVSYVRLLATAPTTLNVAEFYIGNMPSEVPLARINRDDYMNLPDKQSTGRPNLYWLDLQRDAPIVRLWPAPQFQYTFYQLVMQRKRYLMDVGTLTETLDFPQRWFEAVVSELAARVAYEIQEVDLSLIPVLRGAADRAMTLAWTGEGDSSPVYLRPNIRPYTV